MTQTFLVNIEAEEHERESLAAEPGEELHVTVSRYKIESSAKLEDRARKEYMAGKIAWASLAVAFFSLLTAIASMILAK